MSSPEEQTEPPNREFQPITSNGPAPVLTRTHTNGSNIHRSNTASSHIHRTNTHLSHKESKDPELDVNLPYRTFSNAANLEEFTKETAGGEIDGPVEADGVHRYKLVTFELNDPGNPKNWSKGYKWYCTMVVAITCFVVAFNSSVITAGIIGPVETFGVSEEVSLLSITLFVIGFGIGMPLLSREITSR